LIALRDSAPRRESGARPVPSNVLATDVHAKGHKFATEDLAAGDSVIMYGVLVGKAVVSDSVVAQAITLRAICRHQAAPYPQRHGEVHWARPPDVSNMEREELPGIHRSDGQVGTRNYWLVIPLVFCENRNLAC